MPSPFPGMNPYLEQEDAWHDFHERFMPAAAEALSEQVDPQYIVKIDERLYVHELPIDDRRFLGRGDVTLARTSDAAEQLAAVGILDAPIEVQIPEFDVERQSYLEIRDRKTRQLVTVIELLSPSNKRRGSDREQYLNKRRELLASPTHLVEIDLLRGGERMPMDDLPRCDYCALTSRAERRPKGGVWAVNLPDPLPTISIPLHAPDPDARLDLQRLVNRIYDAARYASYIYETSPDPPLTAEQQVWSDAIVRPTG